MSTFKRLSGDIWGWKQFIELLGVLSVDSFLKVLAFCCGTSLTIRWTWCRWSVFCSVSYIYRLNRQTVCDELHNKLCRILVFDLCSTAITLGRFCFVQILYAYIYGLVLIYVLHIYYFVWIYLEVFYVWAGKCLTDFWIGFYQWSAVRK